MIKIKSKFYGWKISTYDKALDYAKWKINAITMGRSDEERLNMVNDSLQGVQFSLTDLLCQE